MLRACFKAVDYWRAHPDEGNEIIAKRLKLPLKDVIDMLSGIKIMGLQDNKDFFSAEKDSPAAKAFMAAAEAWLGAGLIKEVESPNSGIDRSLINDLKVQ